jgi:membrane protease YdiL (CAAX protease family)
MKVILFIALPLLYAKICGEGTILHFLRLDNVRKKDLKTGLVLGISAFVIILSAYGVLGWMIDFSGIKNELQTKLKITASTFIFVGLYVTFINSFIEEFFFRGFVFLNIYQLGYKKTASIFSAFLFGLYHIAIFKTWFPLPITLLIIASLVTVGIVFNHLNIKTRNFLNSWIAHIIADMAIIIIGLKLFYGYY